MAGLPPRSDRTATCSCCHCMARAMGFRQSKRSQSIRNTPSGSRGATSRTCCGASTQNWFCSGSLRTTQPASPWPVSTGFAPRRVRALDLCRLIGPGVRRHVEADSVFPVLLSDGGPSVRNGPSRLRRRKAAYPPSSLTRGHPVASLQKRPNALASAASKTMAPIDPVSENIALG